MITSAYFLVGIQNSSNAGWTIIIIIIIIITILTIIIMMTSP